MKENVLITGAGPNGITGKLIKEKLADEYTVIAPSSKELDLTNDEMVNSFFENNKIDYVIHCATFRPLHNTTSHFVDDILESNLRMYFSLARQSNRFKKMIYFGSGAEFDKTSAIIDIKEEAFGRSIPKDQYGLGKYIMNLNTRTSNNIYNLRLFGTINPLERYTKNVISNICVKAISGDKISLRKNCMFSFVDMDDVILLVKRMLREDLCFHDYNITSGKNYSLADIAEIISKISAKRNPVIFENEGLNLEYTGSNERIISQFTNFQFTDISVSLKKVYDFYIQNQSAIDFENVDSRWK
jgi:nucleoside-diphosphate-sugar epimerase